MSFLLRSISANILSVKCAKRESAASFWIYLFVYYTSVYNGVYIMYTYSCVCFAECSKQRFFFAPWNIINSIDCQYRRFRIMFSITFMFSEWMWTDKFMFTLGNFVKLVFILKMQAKREQNDCNIIKEHRITIQVNSSTNIHKYALAWAVIMFRLKY